MQGRDPAFPLLSLTQLPLQAVIQCLSKDGKRSLASTCKQLAAAVSAASPNTRLTITPSTGWQGLCKVLTNHTVSCKTMEMNSIVKRQHDTAAANNSVLDVLLRYDGDLECSFSGIQQLIINAHNLRCLLPVNIGRCLPDLEELAIEYVHFGNELQRLPYCSSLRKLRLNTRSLPQQLLPSKYHSAAELKMQLPNVLALDLNFTAHHNKKFHMRCASTLLQAWGSQLTELRMEMLKPLAKLQLQHCTRLQCLAWDDWNMGCNDFVKLLPLKSLPMSLTCLQLRHTITEPVLRTILQLPVLQKLSACCLANLKQDWSHHPCNWQQLEFTFVDMVNLGKLPLQTVKVLKIQVYLGLPDPLQPSSLADVMHATECLSNANITVEGLYFWECPAVKELQDPVVPEKDTAFAELSRVASKVVQRCDRYDFNCFNITSYPQAVAVLLNWLAPTLREVSFSVNQEAVLQPWLWQALQCCSHLTKITFNPRLYMPFNEGVDMFSALVLQAAEKLVVVTGRPVNLAIETSYNEDETLLQEAIHTFKSKVQKELPPSISFISCHWATDRCFVVRLEPVKQPHMDSK